MKFTTLLILFFANLTMAQDKNTYVFVHGAWGGGFEYKMVDSILTSKGAKVFRPTLTGLGEKMHLLDSNINLTTHINDVVNMILFEDLHQVILVGHSYGGMVITGVAEKITERLKKLIYVDAFVPNDGESLLSSNIQAFDLKPYIKNGLISFPFAKIEPDLKQPLQTFTQKLSIKNPNVKKIPTYFILMIRGNNEPASFIKSAQRAKERDWKIFEIQGGHNVVEEQPEKLVETLEKCQN